VRRRSTTLLLAQGAVAAQSFVFISLADGATRDGYDQLRQPVSSLALGDRGWTQRGNFLVTGMSMLALSTGLRRSGEASDARTVWGPRLVGAFGVGLLGAGAFATDPDPAYAPEATSGIVTGPHVLHWASSMLLYGALTGACLTYARDFERSGDRSWAVYSAASGAALVGGGVLFIYGCAGGKKVASILGLLQRLTIVVGSGWITALPIRLTSRGHTANRYTASAMASSNWELYRL